MQRLDYIFHHPLRRSGGILRPFLRLVTRSDKKCRLVLASFFTTVVIVLTASVALAPQVRMTFTPPRQPAPRPFSFIVYGDIQGNYRQGHDALVKRMLKENVALVFHTGDISPDDGEDYGRHFYPAIAGLARRTPFFPAMGNHDVAWGSPLSRYPFQIFFKSTLDYLAGQAGNQHLAGPNSQRLWYSLTYGTTLFIVLDSNLFIDEGHYQRTHALDPYRNYAHEQLVWVRDLLENSGRNPKIHAKFVFFHHSPLLSYEARSVPIFGWGGHPGHRRMVMTLRVPSRQPGKELHLLDLFRYHGVGAVFTGHEHYYERWQEIIREKGRTVRIVNWVVNGLGGVKPRGRPEYKEKKIAELLRTDEAYQHYLKRVSALNPDWTAELRHAYPTEENPDARFHNYMLVTVDGSEIRFQTKDISGKVRDAGVF